jgi:hypothetical protein
MPPTVVSAVNVECDTKRLWTLNETGTTNHPSVKQTTVFDALQALTMALSMVAARRLVRISRIGPLVARPVSGAPVKDRHVGRRGNPSCAVQRTKFALVRG